MTKRLCDHEGKDEAELCMMCGKVRKYADNSRRARTLDMDLAGLPMWKIAREMRVIQ